MGARAAIVPRRQAWPLAAPPPAPSGRCQAGPGPRRTGSQHVARVSPLARWRARPVSAAPRCRHRPGGRVIGRGRYGHSAAIRALLGAECRGPHPAAGTRGRGSTRSPSLAGALGDAQTRARMTATPAAARWPARPLRWRTSKRSATRSTRAPRRSGSACATRRRHDSRWPSSTCTSARSGRERRPHATVPPQPRVYVRPEAACRSGRGRHSTRRRAPPRPLERFASPEAADKARAGNWWSAVPGGDTVSSRTIARPKRAGDQRGAANRNPCMPEAGGQLRRRRAGQEMSTGVSPAKRRA